MKMQKSSKADKFGIAVILAAALYFIFSGGPDGGTAGPSADISKATFQGEWPFTVDKGRVYCTHRGELVFVANGNGAHYALNGVAQKNYEPLDAIWKPHPDPDMARGGVKVSVGGVVRHAQKFCQ